MTYQEKYEDLFKAYEQTTKDLHDATQRISFTNGFGDTEALGTYFKAHKKYRFAERDFQQLLNYVTTKNLNPNSEYLECDFMYNFIKEDQRKRGVPWKDEELAPNTQGGVCGYECLIGVTNDGEINRMLQGTEYKFPVINLHHGKECYKYLAKMLQHGGGEEFDANNLKFTNVDESSQVYVKIVITVWE
jgi:hypothetical protein